MGSIGLPTELPTVSVGSPCAAHFLFRMGMIRIAEAKQRIG